MNLKRNVRSLLSIVLFLALAFPMLASADILIDGSRQWDMRVHDERLFARCLRDGTIGLGDAYVEGWWDAPALDEFFTRLIAASEIFISSSEPKIRAS